MRYTRSKWSPRAHGLWRPDLGTRGIHKIGEGIAFKVDDTTMLFSNLQRANTNCIVSGHTTVFGVGQGEVMTRTSNCKAVESRGTGLALSLGLRFGLVQHK